MKKQFLVVGVMILLLGGIVWIFGSLSIKPMVIMGYDGPVATIDRIEHTYPSNLNLLSTSNIGTSAQVDTGTNDLLDAFTPAGVRCEINSAPRVLSTDETDEISRSVIDEEAGTNTTTTVVVHKVKCEMGLTLSTFKGGLQSLYKTTFWIHLSENSFSVFTDADESTAFIVFVETTSLPNIVGSFSSDPQGSGSPVDLTSVGSYEVEQWIIDAGYTSNLNYFKEVEFPVSALDGAPTSVLGIGRTESSATLTFTIDVWLFGEWEQVADYTPWEWPEPPDLFAILASFMWYIAGIVITGLAVWKLKGKTLVAVLIGTWVLVLWMSGVIPDLLGASG